MVQSAAAAAGARAVGQKTRVRYFEAHLQARKREDDGKKGETRDDNDSSFPESQLCLS